MEIPYAKPFCRWLLFVLYWDYVQTNSNIAQFESDFQCLSMEYKLMLWKHHVRADICCNSRNQKSLKLKKFQHWRFSEPLLLSSGFKFDPESRNFIREVRNSIFSFVNPTPMKTAVQLVAISSNALENTLDLDTADCNVSRSFLDFISGNKVLNGSFPLAHRYGGHQFGSWAGQLGDGRAHLLGEYVNSKNERWELQLKGSGQTPYSRRGDGRAVLRSSVREFLCSEALHHLGIATSRAVTLIVSDDPVTRDQFYNGNIKTERAAVVLRLAPSWFRIGSLEILESNNEIDLLRHLVDFIIQNYYHKEVDSSSENKYVQFFGAVFNRTLVTVTKWMAVGFTHGVCNTDNYSLLGLTIDFGPFGFVEEYDENFVPNTSDDEGRYSLGKQPSIAMHNLDKLRIAISPLLDKKDRKNVSKILHTFDERYQELLINEFRKKLGLFNEFENDSLLLASLLYLMQQTRADFTSTFRQLSELTANEMFVDSIPSYLWALKILSRHEYFSKWLESYRLRLEDNPGSVSDEIRMKRMCSVNPRYVLRNWMAEEAIQKAEKNDFSVVRKLLKILQRPHTKQIIAEKLGYASPSPDWATHLKVSCSS
ncbi:protein nucleotidyltransferase YdiU-like [Styela clava]|uniref:protein adenylyltransferase SelO-like n=1 Tax=Styela clava TaxID=7725 RepID=UPI00193A8A6E|nr:protein adenylyltransferase SelO-like [Styela clava]